MKRKRMNIPLYITKFCKDISCEKPFLVPLRPIRGKPVNECFTVVPKHVSTKGGKQIIGWSIHVWKGVLIEAEFHCVWQSPEGEIVDITPKVYEIDNIIFLPDPTKKYIGRQVDNIRKSISRGWYVSEFISLSQAFFRYTNKGDLAYYHGEITIEEGFIDQYNRMQELQFLIIRKHGSRRGIPTCGRFVNYVHKSPLPSYKIP